MKEVQTTKTISAGILVKCGDQYIIGHVTNNSHYDIFKGRSEDNETLVETAIRECQEESSLNFKEDDLNFLGIFNYTKKKNLALFISKIDKVNLDSLYCSTYTKDDYLEMYDFIMVDFDTLLSKVAKSMNRALTFYEKEIKEY